MSNWPPDAPRIACAVRSHWGLENGMHWSLDMAFGEDQSRVHVDNASQNFATLRRISMNLLRRYVQTKAGLKAVDLKPVAAIGIALSSLVGKGFILHAIALHRY